MWRRHKPTGSGKVRVTPNIDLLFGKGNVDAKRYAFVGKAGLHSPENLFTRQIQARVEKPFMHGCQ